MNKMNLNLRDSCALNNKKKIRKMCTKNNLCAQYYELNQVNYLLSILLRKFATIVIKIIPIVA